MTNLNKNPQDLKVGQLVTTDFENGAELVVRSLIGIRRSTYSESGYAVYMDGGEPCPHCQRPFAKRVGWIDAGWAIPVDKENR